MELDLEYHDGIGTVRKAVLGGSVLTILIALVMMFGTSQGPIMIIAYTPFLITGFVGIIGALGISSRKPNSIFLCKVFVWICTIYNLFTFIIDIAMGNFPSFMLVLLFFGCLYILVTLYTSSDVKLIFPKEYRKIKAFDIVLAVVCIGLVILLVLLMIKLKFFLFVFAF